MKKKISIRLLEIAAIAIILSMVSFVAVFYGLSKKEVMSDLKNYADLLKNTAALQEIENNTYKSTADTIRITLISDSGIVEYDSNVTIGSLDNHSERPEVAEAFETGEGTAVRKSSTLNANTFYYACKINDQYVLRIAREANSAWSILQSGIPWIIGIALILFVFCISVSHFLVNSILQPIHKMTDDMNWYRSSWEYKEMVPFVETIRKQHEDILQSTKIRQEFTANISHELKTPLTSISGYAELIEHGLVKEEDTVRFAKEIRSNANRLLTLINDIIELSKLDDSEMEIKFEEMDLYEIAKKCVKELQINAQNRKITLEVTGDSCRIRANRQMIEEMLYNLCDNAIRYNDENGYVHVFVKRLENNILLSVQDNGIGISIDDQERIFERFFRVDKSRSKSTGGTGLGLAIVKHIVERHNAKLELDSKLGKGTEIRIKFTDLK